MKNFQLFGIADKVTFGQSGFIIHNDGTAFLFRNADDTDYVEAKGKYPTTDDSLATKKYVDDNVGSGGYTSPVTTKGDLFVGDSGGGDGRLPIGSNNFVLVPDSAQSNGLKWLNLATHPTVVNLQTQITNNTDDIVDIENDILGINTVLSDHETRIDNLETNDSAQDITLGDHETRITTLEGSSGGGGNDTLYFKGYPFGGINGTNFLVSNGSFFNALDATTDFQVNAGLSKYDAVNFQLTLDEGWYRITTKAILDKEFGENNGFNKFTSVMSVIKASGTGNFVNIREQNQFSASEDEYIYATFSSFFGFGMHNEQIYWVNGGSMKVTIRINCRWTGTITTNGGQIKIGNPTVLVEKLTPIDPTAGKVP
jgi:hypothetical protein